MTTANARAEAVTRAVTLLNASGAQFAVLFDGLKYGDLNIVTTPTRTATNWNAKYGHVKQVDAMKVGDELQFVVEPEDKKRFMAALRTLIVDRFGPDSYIMDATESAISVLLIEITKSVGTEATAE